MEIKQDKITKDQKEMVAMLSIGTLLEYFDVFLYIHLAVLIDKLFFPSEASESWFLSTIAFSSTFIFRPIGGMIFGWIGDKIGRTFSIFITTFFAFAVCLIMSVLPTYSSIGIAAAYILTFCRIIQGIVAGGEFYNAHIYLAESIGNIKNKCTFGVILCIGSWTGGKFISTAVVATVLYFFDNGIEYAWRIAFLIGAAVAFTGSYARRLLREALEFINAKKSVAYAKENGISSIEEHPAFEKKVPKLSLFHYFILSIGNVFFALFPFTYAKDLLVEKGYSLSQIVSQNFLVGSVFTLVLISYAFLVRIICPFKILRYRSYCCVVFLLIMPFLLDNANSRFDIFLLQCAVVLLGVTCLPASPLIYETFPVLYRSRCIVTINSFGSAISFLLLNACVPFFSKYFANYTFMILGMPIALLSILSANHFHKEYKNLQN